MAVMETSELYKTGTELRLNLQQKYDAESALPENRNDPHFGDRFMAEAAPLLDQWGGSASTDHGKQLAATLKAGIRNEIFNHVVAGQSEMDSAHVIDNGTQTMNSLGAGLITDPSEPNLNRTLGTAKDAIDGMTMSIPDVGTRERVATQLRNQYYPQLVMSRYAGVGESVKNQIAATGDETSPALEQLNKDIAGQLGFQYLDPAQQARLPEIRDEAVRQGQELFKSKQATIKAETTEKGKSAYAEIHNAITALALKGQGPTPDLIETIGKYAQVYGATNPGEVASLDDYIVRGQDRAQSGAVQSFNQSTRDSIQTNMSLPEGDPRRPTLASLTKAWSSGQITKEDLSRYTEILGKLDKPETDPTFAPAWQNFQRWQNQISQSIGNNGFPGTAAARAQFLHDSTAAFMAQGKGTAGWDKTLDTLTNAQNPSSFSHSIEFYKKAAMKPDAAKWLQQHDQYDPHGLPAYGSKAAPVYPTAHPAPAQPTKLDQKDVDAAIWGKH
jgi:hypothetical protein